MSRLTALKPILAFCLFAFSALALARTFDFHVPSGAMKSALDTYVKQAGVQLVYKEEDVRGISTQGVNGTLSAEEALTRLLAGTPLIAHRDPSGAVAIVQTSSPAAGASDASEASSMQLSQAGNASRSASVSSQSTEAQRPDSARSNDASSSSKVEEIIVTAQKRVERLQDVPLPVTAIDGETLASSNQLRLQDYFNRVPGLTWSTKDVGEPIIAIRGLLTGAYTNPTVGIVIDDVPYGPSIVQGTSPSVPDIDPGDLARVEVLRGPQGTLYGAASLGGLIKFVTVDPSTEGFSGRVQAGTSTVQRSDEFGYSARGSINVPLGDTVAVRVSGFTLRDPGYVDNIQTGEDDVNRRDSEGARLSALWRPSDRFSLKLNALIQDSETLGPAEVDSALGNGLRRSFLIGTGAHRSKTSAFSATLTGKAGRVDLFSATGYSTDQVDTSIDTTMFFGGLANALFPGATAVATVSDVDTNKFTQELRASLPIGERIDLLLGAFYTRETLEANVAYLAEEPATGAVRGSVLSVATPTEFRDYAAFANLAIQMSERFDVQLGARRFENEQSFSTVRGGVLGGSALPETRAKDGALTYLVTPRLRISPDLMLYTRLASGYRPGGANGNCQPDFPCEYTADETRNYEVGAKGNFAGGRVAVDVSLYHIDWNDIQLTLFNPNFVPYIDNAGKARSRGVELALESRLASQWTLSGWVAVNDAELTEQIPASSRVVGNKGDRLPYGSRLSANLSIDREIQLSANAAAFVGGSLSYIGERRGLFRSLGAVPTDQETLPSYLQVDLRSGVRYGSWAFDLYANNLTDERGVLKGGRDSNSATFVTYIQPRTIGMSIGKTF